MVIYVPRLTSTKQFLSVWAENKETLLLNYALDIREGHIEIVALKMMKRRQ